MDRISGSGNADDFFAVEMTLRNHPPQEPFVVRREHPLMVIDVQLVQQS